MIELYGKYAREHRMPLSELEDCIRSGAARAVPDPFEQHLEYPDSCYSEAVIREREKRLAVFVRYIAASDEERFDEVGSRELIRDIWDKNKDVRIPPNVALMSSNVFTCSEGRGTTLYYQIVPMPAARGIVASRVHRALDRDGRASRDGIPVRAFRLQSSFEWNCTQRSKKNGKSATRMAEK